MARPTKLHLVLNETYPTRRGHDEKPCVAPLVIQDMSHMANFVYNFYSERVKLMKHYYEQAKPEWKKPGELDVKERSRGEEGDTDSEEEGTAPQGLQVPVPIQEEPIEEVPDFGRREDEEMREDGDEGMEEDGEEEEEERVGGGEMRDTGEVENDE